MMHNRCFAGGLHAVLLLGLLFSQSLGVLSADPPRLSDPVRDAPFFRFTLSGEASGTYVTQRSTNRLDWTSIATNRSTASTQVIQVRAVEEQSFFRAFRMYEPIFNHAIAAVSFVDL